MAIRQAIQIFALALTGATLAGCVQHTAERPVRDGSPQAAAAQPAPHAAPQRRAAPASRKRIALAARPAAMTDGAVGMASFYKYPGRTASGEPFNPGDLTAAHRTLPFGTRLRVTDVATGQSVTVRVNDRGPFVPGRVVDVSHSAAQALGMVDRGVARVKLEVEK